METIVKQIFLQTDNRPMGASRVKRDRSGDSNKGIPRESQVKSITGGSYVVE